MVCTWPCSQFAQVIVSIFFGKNQAPRIVVQRCADRLRNNADRFPPVPGLQGKV
jgi:hypothetical protein